MDEHVSKSAVQQMLHEAYADDVLSTKDGCKALYKRLDDIPAADVQPVKQGKWIYVGSVRSWDEIKCSACDTAFSTEDRDLILNWDFCPNCGARMDGEQQ